MNHANEQLLREWYDNGEKCGSNFTGNIVQEYVRNPYLYNGFKLEFRTYFSIVSTDPTIVVLYKKALVKSCA